MHSLGHMAQVIRGRAIKSQGKQLGEGGELHPSGFWKGFPIGPRSGERGVALAMLSAPELGGLWTAQRYKSITQPSPLTKDKSVICHNRLETLGRTIAG